MRAVYAILLCPLFCPLCSARADVIFSGSVLTFTTGGGTPPCSASGMAPASLSLVCSSSDPTTTASILGNGDLYSGSLILQENVDNLLPVPRGEAQGSLQVQLDQDYVLTGGTGLGTVEVGVVDEDPVSTARLICSVTIDASTQPCDGTGGYTELVQYGVPFSIELDMQINGAAINGSPILKRVFYEIEGPGLQATPEPPSVLLLLPGLAGVFAARSRLRGKGMQSFAD